MRRITAALMAVGAAIAVGAPSSQSRGVCHGRTFTIHQFIRYAKRVLPDPTTGQDRALRLMAHCMEPWRRPLARRWRNRYENPPGWAIPWYIVACESSGQNLAPNSAGASGYYQIIPETWASHGGYRYASEAYLASKRGQDIIARRIWTQDGAGQWDCA